MKKNMNETIEEFLLEVLKKIESIHWDSSYEIQTKELLKYLNNKFYSENKEISKYAKKLISDIRMLPTNTPLSYIGAKITKKLKGEE